FTYRSFNGILGSVSLATVTISVKESNDAPVVPDLAVTASRNGEFRIGEAALITASNAKPGPATESFQTLKVSNVSATSTQGGTVAWNNGQIIYRPAINFIGSDSFTYRLIDNGKTDGSDDFLETVGTVVVTVQD
ncbi:MAG: Ig-like domain-containing protein, partial [Pirellulaceae bacterium]